METRYILECTTRAANVISHGFVCCMADTKQSTIENGSRIFARLEGDEADLLEVLVQRSVRKGLGIHYIRILVVQSCVIIRNGMSS